MSKKLTNADFCKAAKSLKCGVAHIKAVAEVESLQNGFLKSGKPVILFERHKFRYYSKGRFSAQYPDISGPAGGYGNSGEHQWDRFSKAFGLDPVAAMLSCSWGKFQVMGFNYAVAGYRDIHDFVDAMKRSEGDHLNAFVNFVKSNRIDDELRNGDWKGFAYRYNGSGYKKNKYDTKMATAFKKYSRENIDCDAVLNPVLEMPQIPQFNPQVSMPESAPANQPVEPTEETTNEQPAETPASTPSTGISYIDQFSGYSETASDYANKAGAISDKGQAVMENVGKVSKSSLWTTISGKVGGWIVVAIGLFEDKLPIIIVGAVIVVAILLYLTYSKKRATERVVALGTGSG